MVHNSSGLLCFCKDCKKKNNDSLFKGALASVSEISGGHQAILKSVQCLEYDLEDGSEILVTKARNMLNRAFCRIKSPIKVRFILNIQTK